MKALRSLRTLTASINSNPSKPASTLFFISRFYAAQPQEETPINTTYEDENSDSVFDSTHYELPVSDAERQPTWDEKYRGKANEKIFGQKETLGQKTNRKLEKEEEKKRRAAALARAMLEAALEQPDGDDDDDDEDEEVKEEDQKSLSVGIIGAPNAGKSALTNYMVGTKVAAVSRKTNTTTHEVLGVMTEGDTQIEIPYGLDHRLVDWKELRDGSLRIEQHFITPKMSQRKILVGKNGSKIGRNRNGS